MADFGMQATYLQESSSAVAPLQGVATPAKDYTIPSSLMSLGASLVGGVIDNEKKKAEQAREDAINKHLSDYSRRVAELSSAEELSVAERNSQIKALGNQYAVMAAEGGWIKELGEAAKLSSQVGTLGEVEDAIQTEREERKQFTKQLTEYGATFDPNASTATLREMARIYGNQNRAYEDWSRSNTKLLASQHQDDRTEDERKRKRQAQVGELISNMASTEIEATNVMLKEVAEQVISGSRSTEEGLAMLMESKRKVGLFLAKAKQDNPEYATTIGTMFEDLYSAYQEQITNPSKVTQERIEASVKKAAWTTLQTDPDSMAVATTIEMFGSNIVSDIAVSNAVGRILPTLMSRDTSSDNSIPNNIGIGNKDDESDLIAFTRKALGTYDDPNATPKMKQEAATLANNILDQLGDRVGNRKITPADLVPITNLIANVNFAKFVKAGGMDPAIAETASEAYRTLYETTVVGALGKSLAAPLELGGVERHRDGPDTPPMRVMDMVDISYTASGIRFTMKKDLALGSGSRDVVVRERIRNLNTEKMHLDKLIRVGAHLEGTTDYAKFWEDNKSRILPDYFSNKDVPIGTEKDGWKLKAYPYTNKANWERSGEGQGKPWEQMLGDGEAKKTSSTTGQNQPYDFETVLANQIQAESRGQHRDSKGNLLTSSAGAEGISQVMPKTGVKPGYGVKPLQDDSEEEYLRFHRDYMEAMMKEFDQDVEKAVAAYNAGPGSVKSAVRKAGRAGRDDWWNFLPKKSETLVYMNKILAGNFN